MKGYGGKILYVDLSRGKIRTENIGQGFVRKYLGGTGFATRLLYDLVPKNAGPLSKENVVIISPGMLVATGVPTASKTAVVSKSPLTGGFGRAIAGAYFGVELRKSGYDALVISGAAEKPQWLYIQNETVELRSADEIWGKTTRATNKVLAEECGSGFHFASIGPAGENLSKIAIVDFEERQAARTGIGAVLGSKKLKAIAAHGDFALDVADEEKMRELIVYWSKTLREHPAARDDMNYGTGEFYAWMNRERGTFPSRNWQWGYLQSVFDNLSEEGKSRLDPYYWAPKYTAQLRPCPNCNKPCGRIFKVSNGRYAGVTVDGVEYEVLYSLGGVLEIDNIEAVAKANEVCDLMGLDAISAGVTVAWAMEAFERGLLTTTDTEGIELRFGNEDAVIAVLQKMGMRDGRIGNLLADGVRAAVSKLGKGGEFALHVKGLEPPAYDVRGIKGMALAYAVAVRGADHLTAGVYGTELVGKWWKFEGVDRFSAQYKGFEIKIHEDIMSVYDITGICKFSRHMYFIEELPEIITACTGMYMDTGSLLTIGERVYNLQKCFNVREGFRRKDDTLPPRIMREPIPKGPSAGSYVSHEELETMLDEYYHARGWNREGIPTKAKLVALDLAKEAEEIGAGI